MANKIPIDLDRVAKLAGRGLTQAEIATSLGISADTLQRRAKESAAFAAAIEKGKADAAETVANRLFELVEKRNLGAIIWFEKTRRGMSETVRNEHTGKDGGPMVVKDDSLTDEERANRVSTLLDKARARRVGQIAQDAADSNPR